MFAEKKWDTNVINSRDPPCARFNFEINIFNGFRFFFSLFFLFENYIIFYQINIIITVGIFYGDEKIIKCNVNNTHKYCP